MAIDTSSVIITTTTNSIDTSIIKLAGESNIFLASHNNRGNLIHISVKWHRNIWILNLSTNEKIYSGTRVFLNLQNDQTLSLAVLTNSHKSGIYWKSIIGLIDSDMDILSKSQLKSIIFDNEKQQSKEIFTFQYRSFQEETQELFRIICFKLFSKYLELKSKYEDAQPVDRISNQEDDLAIPIAPNIKSLPIDGPILNRQYNLKTKYGRRMSNKQAQYNYHYGSQNYRDEIDNIKFWVWLVIIIICIITFIVIWKVSGPEAAIKWLK